MCIRDRNCAIQLSRGIQGLRFIHSTIKDYHFQIQLWITQSDAWGYKGSVVLGWDVSLDISENNYISRTRYPGNESVIQFMTINISIHTRLMMSKQLKQLYYQHPHIKSGSRHWLIRVNEYIVSLLVYLSLIHISEPTRRYAISYAVFCLKKKK